MSSVLVLPERRCTLHNLCNLSAMSPQLAFFFICSVVALAQVVVLIATVRNYAQVRQDRKRYQANFDMALADIRAVRANMPAKAEQTAADERVQKIVEDG